MNADGSLGRCPGYGSSSSAHWVELFGSLGATGAGHGTPGAVVLGLEGFDPQTVDPTSARARVEAVASERRLLLPGGRAIEFDTTADIVLSLQAMDFHSNGVVFNALRGDGSTLARCVYYSVGAGFVVDEDEAAAAGW